MRFTPILNMPTDEGLIRSLADEIEDYLARHPHAADGVEGIMRWWLQHERRGKTEQRVRAALLLLEREGVVNRSVLLDGHAIYGRAPPAPQNGSSADT